MVRTTVRVDEVETQWGVDFVDWIFIGDDEDEARRTVRMVGGTVIVRQILITPWAEVTCTP